MHSTSVAYEPVLGITDQPFFVAPTEANAERMRQAFRGWKACLGESRTYEVGSPLENTSTFGHRQLYPSVRPTNHLQVAEVVRIALSHAVSLYPVSTGNNWGYGAAAPAATDCVVVDLSDLRGIRVVDAELGLIAVEPGVTQGMLADFLIENQLDLLTPVHGGGPACSLVGNALERGYGLTPTTDHFASVTSLRAVLPDGSSYQSAFHAKGAPLIGACHRWGIGPYVEGLFSQGNFGIVTEATFALARRPEHVEAFFVRIANDEQLGEMVDHLRRALGSLGANVAGVNLMNDRRILSMSRRYPIDRLVEGDIISDSMCQEMTKHAGISKWTAAGVIHCPLSMRASIRKELRRLLPSSISRPIHFNRRRIRWGRSIASWLPIGGRSILQQLSSIEALLDLADGIPQRVALPLAYWLRGEAPRLDVDMDPARDGCGLIWYSPLVPMKSNYVHTFAAMVNRVCKEHRIEPLITLTSLSERLFDSTVPILYRPEQKGAAERAQACYDAMFEAGRAIGCLPYRVGVRSMSNMLSLDDGSHMEFVERIKRAIDPNEIIAPGRYCQSRKSLC